MGKILNSLKKFWSFLKKDTWQAWLVSLVLAFLFIKIIFFPFLSFALATDLPLVVVESCSMYHSTDFDSWWESNSGWYGNKKITKENFESFKLKDGLNKGDIVLVSGWGGYKIGDIIIFNNSPYKFPLIHRVVDLNPTGTKGDNGNTNANQLQSEKEILEEAIIGKSIARIPGLGWIKLVFFERFRPVNERGFCK
jgi:signal peptidase I